jgi:hypothetical protein
MRRRAAKLLAIRNKKQIAACKAHSRYRGWPTYPELAVVNEQYPGAMFTQFCCAHNSTVCQLETDAMHATLQVA